MPIEQRDVLYMQRALTLAQYGQGAVSPNPMVGCVLVKEGQIIGEGWHQQYGGPHAEVNAVAQVKDHNLLKGCTAYVSLEPCAHYGKTPPCADLLVSKAVGRVVICHVDSNPQVGGKGIAKLQEAGINVETGLLAEEGRWLNRRFLTQMEKQRPYIILKWAQTADGFVARSNYDSKWISGVLARKLVHKWRAEEDAIMVGRQTAYQDNPKLTVRDWEGKNPVRVVIDRYGKLPDTMHLFDQQTPTLCYTLSRQEELRNLQYIKLTEARFWQDLLLDLYQRKVQSLFVEGGTVIFQQLLQQGLWDEARIFTAPRRFGTGISAPQVQGELLSEQIIADDHLSILLNPNEVTIPLQAPSWPKSL